MRTRFAVLATVMSALTSARLQPSPMQRPSVAQPDNHTTAPGNRGPDLWIYGRLTGLRTSQQAVVLFHRIVPAARFTIIGVRRTNSLGLLPVRAARRDRRLQPQLVRRGTTRPAEFAIHEKVSAQVSLASSTRPRTPAIRSCSPVISARITRSSGCCCRSRTASVAAVGRRSPRRSPAAAPTSWCTPLGGARNLHAARGVPRRPAQHPRRLRQRDGDNPAEAGPVVHDRQPQPGHSGGRCRRRSPASSTQGLDHDA